MKVGSQEQDLNFFLLVFSPYSLRASQTELHIAIASQSMRKTSSHGSPIPSSSRQGSLGPQSPLRIIPSTTQYEWGGSPVYPPPPAPAPAPYDPTVTIPIDSYRPNYSQDAYPPPPPPPQDFYNNNRNNHSNGNHNGGGYNSYGGGQRGGGHMYGNDRPPYYDDFPPPGGNNHYGPPPVSNFPQEHNNVSSPSFSRVATQLTFCTL